MSIPTYNEFYDSILELLSDGQIHNSKETIEYCANAFQLSDEERMLRIPSNRQTVLANRVGWARTYLKKAGLITAHQRGQYKITEAGLTAVKDKNAKIDNDYLSRFPEFRKFINNPSVDPDGSQRCLYLIQSNDSRAFEHPRVHFNRCCTDWLSS